jgi:hypothetical protein
MPQALVQLRRYCVVKNKVCHTSRLHLRNHACNFNLTNKRFMHWRNHLLKKTVVMSLHPSKVGWALAHHFRSCDCFQFIYDGGLKPTLHSLDSDRDGIPCETLCGNNAAGARTVEAILRGE